MTMPQHDKLPSADETIAGHGQALRERREGALTKIADAEAQLAHERHRLAYIESVLSEWETRFPPTS